ncbi:MAG: Sjogren's syndrome/scleroderma autoantigen 1 family protein [Candidatus Heimdallarchaeaceae archaeon]
MDKTTISDDSIKAGAEILLKGGVMLNKACPTCKSPLYKYQGKIICVNCKKQYVLVDDISDIQRDKKLSEEQTIETKSQMKPTETSSISSNKNRVSENIVDFNLTLNVLKTKLADLTTILNNETDPTKIAEIAKAIKEINNAIRDLSS